MEGMPAATRYLATLVLLAGCAFADTVEITYASPIDLTASGSVTFSYPRYPLGPITFTFSADDLANVPELPGYHLVGFDNFFHDFYHSAFFSAGSPLCAACVGYGFSKKDIRVDLPTAKGEVTFYGFEYADTPTDKEGCPFFQCGDAFSNPLTSPSFTTYYTFSDSLDPNWPTSTDPAVVYWWASHYPAEITISGHLEFMV